MFNVYCPISAQICAFYFYRKEIHACIGVITMPRLRHYLRPHSLEWSVLVEENCVTGRKTVQEAMTRKVVRKSPMRCCRKGSLLQLNPVSTLDCSCRCYGMRWCRKGTLLQLNPVSTLDCTCRDCCVRLQKMNEELKVAVSKVKNTFFFHLQIFGSFIVCIQFKF